MGCVDVSIIVLCLCGIGLSSYAIHIKRAKDADQNFQATCDLDETISCTHAIMSEYSRGFGIVGRVLGEEHFLNIPNSYMGLIFFPVMLLLALSSSWIFLYAALFLSLASTATSVYLVYLLTYVLKTICLVCLPVHLINTLLLILYTMKWKLVEPRELEPNANRNTSASKSKNKNKYKNRNKNKKD